MLPIFVILISLGISLSAPSTDSSCTTDNVMWFVFDYYSCSKLQDPTDKLGIYKTRKERCKDPLTDCCVTCEQIRQEYSCEDEMNGVTVADGTYECARLRDVNDRLGIYKNRLSICRQPVTQCCVTCKDIGADCELSNTGVYLADGSYSCNRLLDLDDKLGIYGKRKEICEDKQTRCCITCETVRQELAANASSSEGTKKPTIPAATPKTITGGNPINQGCERNVWIAGGGYDCSYLLDRSNKYGIYKKRHEFCANGIADCCVTCDQILKDKTTNKVVTKVTRKQVTSTTTVKQTVGGTISRKVCENYVWVAGGSYECSFLLDRSNKHGIFNKRHEFCDNGIADCCITCEKIRREKSKTPVSPQGQTATQTVTHESEASACKDEYIYIYNKYYECGRLTDTSNSYDIYRRRTEICLSDRTKCCQTCKLINEGSSSKPSGLKNKDENNINKPRVNNNLQTENNNIVIQAQAMGDNNAAQSQKTREAVTMAIQESLRNFFNLLAQFRAGSNGLFNRS